MAAPPSLPMSISSNNEEEVEKEISVDEMISNLPTDKGCGGYSMYLYQGFWYSQRTLKGTIIAQQNFKAQSTDILLATHPKCGTTWLKSLAFAIINRATLPAGRPQNEEHPLLNSNPHLLVHNIEIELFESYTLEEIEKFHSPRLFGTHLPYASLPESVSNSGCKVVYLCRDPKDVIVSVWLFWERLVQKMNLKVPVASLQETFDWFCQGKFFHGPYWDHVLEYYKASLQLPERVLFLKYEDMHSDSVNKVKRMAEFMGYPFSSEEESNGVVEEIVELCSFENISNLEVNKKGELPTKLGNDAFFRKGKVGDSNNYLTSEMAKHVDAITKEKFQGLEIGY